jgi:hypothetical protein
MLRLLLFAASLFLFGLVIPSTDANQPDLSSSQVINLNMQDVMGKLRRMKRTTTKRWF